VVVDGLDLEGDLLALGGGMQPGSGVGPEDGQVRPGTTRNTG
jgi:hypothetical protein